MEDSTRNIPNEQPTSEETLGRRQLLKALAATTGAIAAASMLPGEWAKPVVEAGVLPAHAQVTPQPLSYSMQCDSTPGGGDITINDGIIANIRPLLVLISGVGPVAGITATMTATATLGSLPTFNPPLPRHATTDASGRADFGSLQVSGSQGQQFMLVFDFDTPAGTVHSQCGEFCWGLCM
jgi:hypothetical protein